MSDTIQTAATEATTLGIFTKPYYAIDSPFNSYRDNRIIATNQ